MWGSPRNKLLPWPLPFALAHSFSTCCSSSYNWRGKPKAGKLGTFVIFLGLTFGMLGFAAKYVIQWALDIK